MELWVWVVLLTGIVLPLGLVLWYFFVEVPRSEKWRKEMNRKLEEKGIDFRL